MRKERPLDYLKLPLRIQDILENKKYYCKEAIQRATNKRLLRLKGIGPIHLKIIRDTIKGTVYEMNIKDSYKCW